MQPTGSNADSTGGLVRVERHGSIAVVTLDRPGKLNAQTVAMWEQLAAAGEQLIADRSVRVAIVTGSGRSFSSGLDLTDMATRLGRVDDPSAEDSQIGRWAQASTSWLADSPFPTIAAIRGHAYGAGLQLALGADIRIASETAKFAAMEAKYGLIPDMGGVEWLPRLVGPAKAAEMIFFAQPVDADEAHRIGLVNRLVDDADLERETMGAAEQLAATSPRALRHAKSLLRASYLHPGTAIPSSLASQIQLIGSQDFTETMTALSENRQPRYED